MNLALSHSPVMNKQRWLQTALYKKIMRILMPARTAQEERWDALLTSEEGQALLEKLAAEALAEYRAGRTRDSFE